MNEKIFIVQNINGDYATLISEADKSEIFISMFLLPDEIDIGDKLVYTLLKYEKYEEKVK